MSEATCDLVLGTAGHIDHGKSSLVLALTGTDPDRLREEKQRGITIELGFAQLELPGGLSLGVVDVPGHERFVRQMIAGSTGIDLALLCIAADDGVMPQTEEHLAVLELLGIPSCVVALTKVDLVDAEWAAFMADEVRARLAGGPYADSSVVPVSSRTGEGLDALRDALAQAARAATRAKAGTALRLPVDRVFTIKGAGTVVTGTLWSGTAAVGDEVEVLPRGIRARIRSVQVHGQPVERAGAGHRTALNLNGVSTDEVRPGDFLAAPGAVRATDRFDAELTYLGLPGSDKPLESGARVHVAHGTREVVGRVLFMGGGEALARGGRCYVQVRLDEDLPVLWRDRFVIRSYSPVHVVGGGVVLRAHPRRTTTLSGGDRALLDALRADDAAGAASAAFGMEPYPVTAAELAEATGLAADEAAAQLAALEAAGGAVRLDGPDRTPRYAAKRTLQKLVTAIGNALMKFHAEDASATGIAKEALRQRCMPRASAPCFDALLAYAVQAGAAALVDGEVSHPQAGAGARRLEEEAAEALAAALHDAAAAPPAVADLLAGAGLAPQLGYRALGALEKQGRAVKVAADLYFDAEALTALEQAARARLAAGPATAAELKDAMGTSRKYAIPLLEYFDARGVTRRDGEMRVLNV